MRLIEYFKQERRKKNVTQGDLAKVLRVHAQQLSNWETGMVPLPVKHIIPITNYLKLPKKKVEELYFQDVRSKALKKLHGI